MASRGGRATCFPPEWPAISSCRLVRMTTTPALYPILMPSRPKRNFWQTGRNRHCGWQIARTRRCRVPPKMRSVRSRRPFARKPQRAWAASPKVWSSGTMCWKNSRRCCASGALLFPRASSTTEARSPAVSPRRSPTLRIQPGRRGFVVEINASSSELSIAVTRPDGLRQFEATVPAVDLPARVVASAAKMFHERLMSPGIQLSSTEINSLDGVPLDAAGRELIDSLASKRRPTKTAQRDRARAPAPTQPNLTARNGRTAAP